MKTYTYHGLVQVGLIACQFIGAATIIGSVIGSIYLWNGAFTVIPSNSSVDLFNDARLTYLCLGMWFLIVCWLVGTSLINFSPTIGVSEKGLQVSIFIFFTKLILWSDVIDIGYGRPPMRYILVRAKRITFFHRFLGWLYSSSFYPSFLIGPAIEGRELLISEIRDRIAH